MYTRPLRVQSNNSHRKNSLEHKDLNSQEHKDPRGETNARSERDLRVEASRLRGGLSFPVGCFSSSKARGEQWNLSQNGYGPFGV